MQMLKKLEKKTCQIEGVKIEDNRFCISVHYRHVKEQVYNVFTSPIYIHSSTYFLKKWTEQLI